MRQSCRGNIERSANAADIAVQSFAAKVSTLVCVSALLFAGGCTSTIEPKPPNGVRCFKKTLRLQVRPTNLPEWKESGYQIVRFVRLASGEFVAPILQVTEPRFSGPMGEVRHDRVWQSVLMALGSGQAHIDLPLDDEIEEHLIIIRRIRSDAMNGDDPWRVWTVALKDIAAGENSILMLPVFDALGLLKQRKDEKDLLTKYGTANAFQLEVKN